MTEYFIVCGTILAGIGAILTFLHVHLGDAKAWRKEIELLVHKFEPRLNATEAESKLQMEKISKYFTDLEKVNQNQIMLGNELQTIKTRQGLQGGMMNIGRHNPMAQE